MLRFPVSKYFSRNIFSLQNVWTSSLRRNCANESDRLNSYMPEILTECREHIKRESNEETANHFAKALQYTISDGKRVRGSTVVRTYEAFMGPEKLTPYNLKLSGILGICMEMSQAWMLALDDIVDRSKLRRGKPCWYLKEGVGMGAINDSILISKCQYWLLKKYFSHLQCYTKLMETFNEGEMITMCGQTTDYHGSQKPVEEFTMAHYMSISTNKTAEYSYNLPVTLGIVLANASETAAVEKEISSILLEIGKLYQIQDDYLDCFGDSRQFKKIANDIEERKCTWLAVKFMEMANKDQKKLFARIYGSDKLDDVNRVKDLYRQVGLIEEFAKFQDDTYRMIKERIILQPESIPQQLFYDLLNEIYARKA